MCISSGTLNCGYYAEWPYISSILAAISTVVENALISYFYV